MYKKKLALLFSLLFILTIYNSNVISIMPKEIETNPKEKLILNYKKKN